MRKRTFVLVGLLCVLLAVAWFFLLWSPRRAALSDARDRKDQAMAQRDSLQVQLATLRKAAKTHREDKKTLERLEKLVPEDPDLEGYLRRINAIANVTGVEVSTLTPSPPAAPATDGPVRVPPGVNVITLAVSAKGSYPALTAFIDHLYKLDRLIVIDTLNLSSQPNAASLDMSITGRVFTTAAVARENDSAQGAARQS